MALKAEALGLAVIAICGVVGFTAWTPDGFTGQVTALMGEYLPVPMGTDQPADWGIETIVRRIYQEGLIKVGPPIEQQASV